MQTKTGHAGHLRIGNQASGIGNVTTIEAVLGRGENLGVVSQMLNEILYCFANRFIVVDDQNLGGGCGQCFAS
jgi:hypothetical protein